ncbi:MAG: hypothetical protein E5V89_24275 [Mesorhizobium sp.]|nr:MAG: hypothetical protein E5V89_24275 [Mesorhizobium sp.]
MRGFNQGALIIDLSEAYRPAGEGPLERSLRQRSGRFRFNPHHAGCQALASGLFCFFQADWQPLWQAYELAPN